MSVFGNLVSNDNLRGLISISTHSCSWTQEDNPHSLPPAVFAVTKQRRHKEGVRQLTLPVLSHRPNVCLCVKQCVSSIPRLTHRTREDLGHLSCPPLLFPLLLFPPHANSPFPFPLTSLSLSCPHSLLFSLFLSLSPKIVPAVHQPSRSSPSCLPSPNEEPHNNTGHRSRERTGCVHNGPVAPSKTIVPFFSSTLSPLLPGLEKTNLWRGGWREVEGSSCGGPLGQQPLRHLPLLTIA